MIKATLGFTKAFATAVISKLPKLVLNPHSVDNVMSAFRTASADLDKVITHHQGNRNKLLNKMDKLEDLAWASHHETVAAQRVKAKLAEFLA